MHSVSEILEDTIEGRKNAFKTIGGRLLKITYKPKDGNLVWNHRGHREKMYVLKTLWTLGFLQINKPSL